MRTRGIFVIATFLASLLSLVTYAQDTIIKISGEEIIAKVMKITPEIVEYYKFNKTDGPIYSIYTTDIEIIKYPDGSKDIFNNEKENQESINGEFNRKEERESDKFIDKRDGHEYKSVKIGDRWWMAENLKYITRGSVCYDNDSTNCEECGQYYEFEEALSACPEGWHLPTDDEWMQLEIAVGMTSIEAMKRGWRGSGDGQASELVFEGDSGLELELCGKYSHATYDFIGLNSNGYYWTSTINTANSSWTRQFKLRRSIKRASAPQNSLIPLRCIKDSE